jgi:hypothetical protein
VVRVRGQCRGRSSAATGICGGDAARNCGAAAKASGGISASGTAQPILAMQSGVMPWQGFSGCCCCLARPIIRAQSALIPEAGAETCSAFCDWHDVRERSLLAQETEQCPSEQQQGEPTLHTPSFGLRENSVNCRAERRRGSANPARIGQSGLLSPLHPSASSSKVRRMASSAAALRARSSACARGQWP